ncbi:exonuclease SbcC [bacterium A37T11]|nr:exonuclease SbcC [bacterium A37T11]
MIRLKRLYLENFKGIKGIEIVDFENTALAILSGPNGFGKTTIFDAIELCLRGKLERTNQFGRVQKNNADYLKAFYQNTKGRDVVLKALFKDDDNNAHIIIKYLDKNHNGKSGNSRAFKPDAWEIINTYYSQDESAFNSAFRPEAVPSITQTEIDMLFYPDGNLHLSELYPLFNYLQQEDNIYFLRKDEEDKKNELNFLFQTQTHANQLNKLTQYHRQIRAIRINIDGRIRQLGDAVTSSAEMSYQRLFLDKSLGYDLEEPFTNVLPENLQTVYNSYIEEVEDLRVFTANFDPGQYELNKVKKAFNLAASDNEILTAYILQHLFADGPFVEAQELRNKIRKYSSALQTLDSANTVLSDSLLTELQFDATFIAGYLNMLQQKLALEGSLSDIGRIIAELNQTRTNTIEKFNQLHAQHEQSANCPLCNSEWQSMDELLGAIEQKTQLLNEFNAGQSVQLSELNEQIQQNYNRPVREYLEAFVNAPQNQLDILFFERIERARGYADRINRFNVIVGAFQEQLSSFIFEQYASLSRLDEQVSLLRERIEQLSQSIQIDQSGLVKSSMYKELFNESPVMFLSISEIDNKLTYLQFKYATAKRFSTNLLSSRVEKLQLLEDKLLRLKDTYDKAIKRFKFEMIEKIKIPFYIYSGKILQNYQQGLGIFIDMQDQTNKVRFLTDGQSDHDIVHHLSSGQLAVVSIAFCLALNKVYQTQEHFKFLAIDDPVQTLDDINVHSFIELMRHEFSDYHIIMSTHEDSTANYMKYKFSRFGFLTKSINVQNLFYPANNILE